MSKQLDEIFALVRRLESPGCDFTKEQLANNHLCENASRDGEAFRKVVDAVNTLSDIINRTGNDKIVHAGIFVGLRKTHRYLQQKLIIELLEALGSLGLGAKESYHDYTDGRNDFAMSLCKKVRETFKDELFWRDA